MTIAPHEVTRPFFRMKESTDRTTTASTAKSLEKIQRFSNPYRIRLRVEMQSGKNLPRRLKNRAHKVHMARPLAHGLPADMRKYGEKAGAGVKKSQKNGNNPVITDGGLIFCPLQSPPDPYNFTGQKNISMKLSARISSPPESRRTAKR